MIVGAGHVIARSDSFRVAIERCRDHYFYERCPERYQLVLNCSDSSPATVFSHHASDDTLAP